MKRVKGMTPSAMMNPALSLKSANLEAEPELLKIDLNRTAIMVIDVQNAFLSKGGFFDLQAPDISLAENIRDHTEKTKRIDHIKKIITEARAKGIQVIYTISLNSPQGNIGHDSPYWYKNATLSFEREHPELRDKLPIRGTWGAEIIDELNPQEGDILVEKPRYSAFFQTNLDTVLRTGNFKYLIFTGVASNICVEATMRDAYYHEYFVIFTSDASISSGPEFVEEATIFNLKACYGWVTTTENILKAMR